MIFLFKVLPQNNFDMHKLSSPLRYPGSKNKLVKYLHKVLEFNDFKPSVLVEPFVGGGSVFLGFLANDLVTHAVIGDKDRLVFSFWKILFEEPQYLISFVKKVKVNVENFDYYKCIANNESKFSERKLAEACLFLNRTSFSGILANTAGPIGGRKQKSEYKIDCRFNRKAIAKKLRAISVYGSKVTVLPYDWSQTIEYALRKYNNKQAFFYVDPPFYKKADKLYRLYFKDNSLHLALSKKLQKMKHKWILSYDRVPEIKQMYASFIQRSLAFPYSINSPARRIEKEYLITSKSLVRPTKEFLTR